MKNYYSLIIVFMFDSRGSSSDDTELRLAQRSDSAYVGSHTGSTASTPDPDGQNRQTAQPCSAPGSAPNSCRTSPEHAGENNLLYLGCVLVLGQFRYM